MHQLDETDESGNEYNGETRSKMIDISYWDVVYKNRKQAFAAIGGMNKQTHVYCVQVQ